MFLRPIRIRILQKQNGFVLPWTFHTNFFFVKYFNYILNFFYDKCRREILSDGERNNAVKYD